MVMILMTGYALSSSKPVSRLLAALAALPTLPRAAVGLAVLVGLSANLLNWSFGLIVSALFARELAKRQRVDFAWLMAAAYTGFLMFSAGLSSSIALAEATPGSALNITQKLTGEVVPLAATLFSVFNVVPVTILVVIMPLIYMRMQPAEADVVAADSARLAAEDAPRPPPDFVPGLAGILDRAWILKLSIVAAVALYVGLQLAHGTFHLDINSLILIFLAFGLLLHWRPVAYAASIQGAARVTGSLLLHYPLYGGIMGIMTTTGLAGVVAE